ncbi:PREDICTED: uncharacterized protein LOC109174404 [Ipomoea nil]|uniref:uncharacterized protein LOC109174404 n=1 Tax=Ipomoea nil TaxID=35883 RepID=UPI000900E2C9|nr:PREDICTED: uncharacterized protein LOC109174404 [Ipomoea nil]
MEKSTWCSLPASKAQNQISQSKVDPSLFSKGNGNTFIVLHVYVDDILVASANMELITELKMFLDNTFKIKNRGPLGYFLGIEEKSSTDDLNICQRKYVLEILEETGFLGCKPASTPMAQNLKLNHDGTLPDDHTSYRRLVGKLLYLTTTRLDIAYVIQQLSQFVDAPTNHHLTAAHRVLRYIKQSPGQGLFYPVSTNLHLKVFSNLDWANCSETRKSITGYCVFLGFALISWRSKKQATVSRSSSKAEYRGLADTVCEVQWLRYLLHDMQVTLTKPTTIFCDSKSAVATAENHLFHERTKHIDIDCCVVWEKLSKG